MKSLIRSTLKGVAEATALLLVLSMLTACGQGCRSANVGGARQAAAKGLDLTHGMLGLLQDTEMALVCDRTTAPKAPGCVPEAIHRKTISPLFAEAFGYDGDIARLLLAVPEGTPTPLQVLELVARVTALANKILAEIPGSVQKDALVKKLNGG
jgi:hypothetical protein